MSFENNHNPELEAVNRKLALGKVLVETGALTEDEDIPEELYARVDEINAEAGFNNLELARLLTTLEFILTRTEQAGGDVTEALSEHADSLNELVAAVLETEFAEVDDEVAELVTAQVIKAAPTSDTFIEVLLQSLETRKEIMRTAKPFDVNVAEDGLVLGESDLRA